MDGQLKEIARSNRHRLNWGVYLERAVRTLGATLVFAATLWVVGKVFLPLHHRVFLWAFALVPPAMLGVWLWCFRRGIFFSMEESLVVADHLRRNDAEPPARHERPDLYSHPLDESILARRPKLSLLPHLRALAPALIYVLIVALVPPANPPAAASPNLLMQAEVEALGDFLEYDMLDEELEEELKDQLETFENDLREISPEQWEALSEIQDRVAESHERALREVEAADAELKDLQEILAAPAMLPAERLSQKGEELAAALQGMNAFGEKKTLSELQALAQYLKNGQGAEGKGEAGKGQLDPEALKKKLEELRKKLSECKSKCQGAGNCNKPGKGGITRGRGDAEMTYSDNPRDIDAELDMNLIENRFEDDQTYEIGVSYIEPPKDHEETGSVHRVDGAGLHGPGGDVQRAHISPSQKSIIESYFARQGD